MAVEQSGAGASPGPARPVGAARQAADASPGAADGQHDTGQQAAGRHDTGQQAAGRHDTGQQAAGRHDTGQQAAGQHDTGQHDTGQADLEEVKRKFREALERKRKAHASANAEGAQDTGKVQGSHGPAATRRSFRRKSGG